MVTYKQGYTYIFHHCIFKKKKKRKKKKGSFVCDIWLNIKKSYEKKNDGVTRTVWTQADDTFTPRGTSQLLGH